MYENLRTQLNIIVGTSEKRRLTQKWTGVSRSILYGWGAIAWIICTLFLSYVNFNYFKCRISVCICILWSCNRFMGISWKCTFMNNTFYYYYSTPPPPLGASINYVSKILPILTPLPSVSKFPYVLSSISIWLNPLPPRLLT